MTDVTVIVDVRVVAANEVEFARVYFVNVIRYRNVNDFIL